MRLDPAAAQERDHERKTSAAASPTKEPAPTPGLSTSPSYLILNIAVGGHWGGSQGVDPDVYPQELVVDHVRVYEAR